MTNGPFFKVELRLLPTEKGGRKTPIRDDYRPTWDLGHTWLGEPVVNDGRVFLEDATELAPGAEGLARIEPVFPEFWGGIRVGALLPMQEGHRTVGYARVLEIAVRTDYWSPEVAAFVMQAKQFREFVEKAKEYALERRLTDARQRLLELYETATALPDVDPPEGVEPPILERLSEWPSFEAFETYWEVFDPYKLTKPVAGSLSDDLLDIYRDLQRGFALWETSKIAAIWQWRFGFEVHWGDHAVDALRALHRACRKD